jgi:hypothetical protein
MSSTPPWKSLGTDTGRIVGDAEDSTSVRNGGADLRENVVEIRTTGNPTLTKDHIAFALLVHPAPPVRAGASEAIIGRAARSARRAHGAYMMPG